MIFTSLTSLALLSGMFLFSNAAPLFIAAPIGPLIHTVNVSNNDAGLLYDPPYISAQLGDFVQFRFHIKNHTVTQSSFDEPCTPLKDGTDTNFVPVANGTTEDELPIAIFTVASTDPIWIHCRQAANTPASHCSKGMVFAINPGKNDSSNSFAAFQAKAKQTESNSTDQTTSGNTTHVTSSDGTNQTTSGNTTHATSSDSGNQTTSGNTTHATSSDSGNQTTSGNTTHVTSSDGGNQTTSGNTTNATSSDSGNQTTSGNTTHARSSDGTAYNGY